MTRRAMRIAIVNPNTTQSMTQAAAASAGSAARSDTVLIEVTASTGVASVESHVDEAWGALSVVTEIERCEASAERPDAYVVACFGDTGVSAAREAAAGPVVGMTEAALMTASLVAHRFAVITMPKRTLRQSEQVVRNLGLEHRCTVLAVDETVAELAEGSLHLLDLFTAEGRLALDAYDAEAIVLGCAGLADLVGPLQAALGVPVIEGVAAAVTIAEGLVAQSLTTSRALTWARSSSPSEAVSA
ncbi:aspartate/glutamate racemase family protein [Diaminobutyricibacter tongyongensis]|nr:aspartate/glutamate racemase family protein [Diaminobutyricibacter tongyongensis]